MDLPTGVVKDDKYWMNDGNVILIANNTTAFRVYRGLLAHSSPVFFDMFEIGQASDNDTAENCPVVNLSEQPSDIRALLEFMLPLPPRSVYYLYIVLCWLLAHTP